MRADLNPLHPAHAGTPAGAGQTRRAMPTRRTALRGLLAGSVALVAPGGLAACSADADPAAARAAAAASGGTPGRGGTARVAMLGSATDLAFNPFAVSGGADFTAGFAVWDQLAVIRGGQVALGVAEEVEIGASAAEWTIRLRPDVRWHDGSPLTSADVAWTLAQFANPKVSPNYSPYFAMIDVPNLRAVDARTLRVPLTTPRGDFVEAVLAQYSPVLKEGTKDFTKAQGTGPFRLETYRPGISTRLVRNDDYWGGPVHLDGLEILAVADAAARLNAVKGDQADYASGISPAGARTLAGDDAVELRRGGAANASAMCFAFNVSLPPFDDPRVVQALKLAVDRQALVATILSGYGEVGADVVGKGLPGSDETLRPPARDVDRARNLFAATGVRGFTLRAADVTPGLVASAELLGQQLAEAGVTVTVEKAAADTYFADFATVLSTPAQALYFINRPPTIHMGAYTGGSAGFNVTGYRPAGYDAQLAAAQAMTDRGAREQAFVALQQRLQAEDGLVVWGYQETLHAARPALRGVTLTQSIPLFGSAYFAA